MLQISIIVFSAVVMMVGFASPCCGWWDEKGGRGGGGWGIGQSVSINNISLLHWTMIMVGWDEKGDGLDNQRPSTTYILCCIEQWWWLSFLLLAVEGKVRKRGMGGVIVHLPMTSLSLWPIMMVWKFGVANFFNLYIYHSQQLNYVFISLMTAQPSFLAIFIGSILWKCYIRRMSIFFLISILNMKTSVLTDWLKWSTQIGHSSLFYPDSICSHFSICVWKIHFIF